MAENENREPEELSVNSEGMAEETRETDANSENTSLEELNAENGAVAENPDEPSGETLSPRKKKSKKPLAVIIAALAVIALCSAAVIYQNTQLLKTFYQVQSNKVTSNIRIICLADLHLREFGENNERLIKEVKDLSPDMIAIVGDMNMESQPDNYEMIIDLCKELQKIAPLYYSLGNHEIDAMLFYKSQIYNDIKAAGINIMNNESETVNIKGTDIDVIGLTQNPQEFEVYGREFFNRVMKETNNFKLVLNHYPENFMGVIEDYNIDLALAGHAHGGQVRLPFIGGLYAADQGFFPELCDGYHEIENSKLVISRGLGWSGIVPRINNKPEITVVDVSWY